MKLILKFKQDKIVNIVNIVLRENSTMASDSTFNEFLHSFQNKTKDNRIISWITWHPPTHYDLRLAFNHFMNLYNACFELQNAPFSVYLRCCTCLTSPRGINHSLIPYFCPSFIRSVHHSSILSTVHLFCLPFIHSVFHSFILSTIHPFCLSFICFIVQPFCLSFIHSVYHWFILSHSFILSSIHLLCLPLIQSVHHLFILSIIYPFCYSFICYIYHSPVLSIRSWRRGSRNWRRSYGAVRSPIR